MQSKSFFYWNDWKLGYATIVWLFLFLILGAGGACLFYFFEAESLLYPTYLDNFLSRGEFVLDTFRQGPFEFKVPGDVYTISQTYNAEGYLPESWLHYAQLASVALVIVLGFAAVTEFEGLYYYVGLSLLVITLGLMKWDGLHVFDLGNTYFSGIVIALFALPNYYFHTRDTASPYWLRLCCYLAIGLLLAGMIQMGSTEPKPFLYLGTFDMFTGGLVFILFVLLTSIQFPLWVFLNVSRRPSSGSFSNLIIFAMLSLFFVANMALNWLEMRNYLEFDVVLIPPFLCLALSFVVGLWAMWYNGNLTQRLNLAPEGFFLFLAVGLASFLFMATQYATDNQPMIETMEKAVIFVYFPFSGFFTLYLLANFFDLLDEGLELGKVVFQPRRMDMLFVHGFAATTLLALLFQEDFRAFEQTRAAYDNHRGDYYFANKEYSLAKFHYDKVKYFENLDNKANYALAEIGLMGEEVKPSLHMLELSLRNDPMVPAGLRTGALYPGANGFHDALFNLTMAWYDNKESGQLNNNLARTYELVAWSDSVKRFYQYAMQDNETREVAQSNLLAYAIKKDLVLDTGDVLPDTLSFPEKPDYGLELGLNKIAYANKYGLAGMPSIQAGWLPDSLINETELAYLSNMVLRTAPKDSSLMPYLRKHMAHPANSSFYEQLNFLLAVVNYYNGNSIDAMHLLNNFWLNGSVAAYRYGNVLALWMIQKENYKLAAKLLQKLNRSDDDVAQTYLAYALTEADSLQKAFALWDQLANSTLTEVSQNAKQMKSLLIASGPSELPQLNDEYRYLFIRFKKYDMPLDSAWQVYGQIQDPHYQARSLAELMEVATFTQDLKLGESLMEKGRNLKTETDAMAMLNLEYLKLLDKVNPSEMLAQFEKLDLPKDKADSLYFLARKAEAENKTKEAKKHYQAVMLNLPFQTQYLAKTLDFLNKHMDKNEVYTSITKIVQLAPKDPRINQYYLWQCGMTGQEYFANGTLEDLKEMLNETDYQATFQHYDSLRAAYYSDY